MAVCYTDGNGNYFSIQGPDPASAGNSLVETTGVGQGHGTVLMVTSRLPLAGWTVAPNLTDIGGGVWVNGLLVDPSEANS
jgi:hypothetical protein